ncbi:hypothetical protein FSP39_019534 [Pinctada imbricata]|uniref:IgGFc-binding protein N-terminal domain-containing protein n=1 Tax=Pinctada imbricata TaxID=66713 RepID=A0AA88YM65_PINIB|nr:hypothetical protein FSP39_019534 [Pinctada imbricata]
MQSGDADSPRAPGLNSECECCSFRGSQPFRWEFSRFCLAFSPSGLNNCVFSSGREFFMTFGTNFYPYAFRKFVQLLIHSNTSGQANVSIPFQKTFDSINITTGETVYNFSNPGPLDPYYLEIKTKGVYLNSSVPIKVYLINHGGSSTDGFLVYPKEFLSTEYLVSTSQPYINRPYTHFQSEFAILSTTDNNNVSIQLRLFNGSITYNNKTFRNGERIHIVLGRLDTFQIYHPWDMSGTRIVSRFPVAVVAGNRCNVFESYNGCDHFSEMMPPVSQLATKYIAPDFYDYFNWTIQVVAASNHTHVKIHEKNGVNVTKTLKENAKMEVVVENVATIEASSPVLTTLYVHGLHVVERLDPFMTLCPWIDSYKREYAVVVPSLGFESYLAISVETAFLSGIAIDGKVITDTIDMMYDTNVLLDGVRYTVLSVNVTSGPHTISHENDKPFGLIVYGNQMHDSYGFLGGLF